MNLSQAPAPTSASSDLRDEGDTRVYGRRLVLARIIWGLLVILTGGIFIAALPLYVAHLQTICVGGQCHAAQLTPSQAQALFRAFGLSLSLYAVYNVALTAIFALVCLTVGFVIFWRRSTDWMALLVALLVVMLGTAGVTNAVSGSHSALQWSALILGILTFGIFFLVFVLFPNGRLVPHWSGWLVLGYLPTVLSHLFFPDVPGPNLLPFPPVPKILFWLAWFGLNGGLLVAQIYRYRQVSSPLQRQQTKWVLFGGMAAVGEIIGVTLLPLLFPSLNQPGSLYPVLNPLVTTVSQLLVPLSIGFAILRYRLWDIDIVINRTLVYGTLTVSVVGTYTLVVGALGTLLQARGNLLIELPAAGLVAVLFQPLRMRLQRAVNHLLYGERDDPYRVISRLGQRLEAALAPEAVLPTIVETVVQALKLPYAAIALKQAEELVIVASHGTAQGEALHLPLVSQAEQVGELILAPRALGEAFTPADRRLLTDLAQQAGVAAHAVRLTDDLKRLTVDLQHSRERLVTAREEERRRLRRDLHDGLGPQLASLALKLETARNKLAHDPLADSLLSDLTSRTQAAVADIRRLVYALRPPALDELGLVPALREQALQYSQPGPGALLVTCEVPESLPPLSAAVEVAVYRIAQEALTNVVRHARASQCHLRLVLDETTGLLSLEIQDNGCGLSPTHHRGVGLASMRERAEELGGTWTLEPAPVGGTRILTRFPSRLSERGEAAAHRLLSPPEEED